MNNKLVIPKFNSLAKPDLLKVSDKITSLVKDGNMNPLAAFAIAKGLRYVSDKVIKQTESEAMDEAISYNKFDRSIFGAAFSYVEGADMYDYEADKEYSDLKKALQARKDELDMAIQASKSGGQAVNSAGEIVKCPPMKGARKSSLRFNF